MKTLLFSALATGTALFSINSLAQAPVAQPVDPSAFIDQFESTFGKFEGYRRSGAKGVCAVGEFVGTADARALSSASVFSGKAIPVVARFSVGGANPKAPDNTKSQRNLALQFDLPNKPIPPRSRRSMMPTRRFSCWASTSPHSPSRQALAASITGACMAMVSSMPRASRNTANGFLNRLLAYRD